MRSVTPRRFGVSLALCLSAALGACAGGGTGSGGAATGTAGAAGSATGASGGAGTIGTSTAGDTGTTSGTSGAGAVAGSTGQDGAAGAVIATGTGGSGGGSAGGGAGGGSAGGGAGSAAGSGGSAGAGAGGAGPTGSSAGCTMAPAQALNSYVRHDIMVPGLDATLTAMYSSRNYYLRLPTAYDPKHSYPTVFLGPGCGGNGQSVLPIQNASMGNAILVGLSPVGQCFKTNGASSPENQFFDAVLKEVEASSCVDKGRVFVAGFSSGSWLSNQLGCLRAGILRGQGNATGGLPGGMPTCAGPLAAMLAHDTTDTANVIAGGMAARDRILKINGCTGTATVPYDAGTPSPCVSYTGCPAAYPVVWCQTTGKGHSDQIPISTTGFWKFWSSLP
jgi:polyhydroxybutyrate depolymerase